jgi:hypothetical protein
MIVLDPSFVKVNSNHVIETQKGPLTTGPPELCLLFFPSQDTESSRGTRRGTLVNHRFMKWLAAPD